MSDAFANASRPLYVFVDESGNLDFTGRGTDHFVLTAYMTEDPIGCGAGLTRLKYEYLSRGLEDQIPFHASENSAGTRKRVADAMCQLPQGCRIHSIYADKHYAHPSKHDPAIFYGLVGGALGKYLLMVEHTTYSPIVLIFDSALSAKHRKAFLGAVKPQLTRLGRPYRIMFKPVKEDVNGQVADYYAWSLFRRLESGDNSLLSRLPIRHTTFNIFQRGHTRYW